MALVRMLVQLSGTRDGVEWPAAGGLLECPADEAADLVGSALAVAFTAAAAPVVESAALAPAVESATVKRGPGRPRKSEG